MRALAETIGSRLTNDAITQLMLSNAGEPRVKPENFSLTGFRDGNGGTFS